MNIALRLGRLISPAPITPILFSSYWPFKAPLRWPLLVALLVCQPAIAMPVFLAPDSQFASGYHPRKWLEERTRKVQFQRWHRVKTQDGSYGWIPEDYLLTPLKLATEAELTSDLQERTQPEMDALGPETLKKGTRFVVLEIRGYWVKAYPLAPPPSTTTAATPTSATARNKNLKDTWIPSANLTSISGRAPRAFIPSMSQVYALPGLFARSVGSLTPGKVVEIFREKGSWLEIRYKGAPAYLPRKNAVTLSDLSAQQTRALNEMTPLRSAPLPYADLIKTLSPQIQLEITQTEELRWGQARVPQVGEVWWPISDDFEDEKALSSQNTVTLKLLTAQLFSRKIFDMAASPAIPSLKFVSAQGVFRTVDGSEWSKIPVFRDENYPIAIAGAGPVFIGPYVSDDHGETFQQWIRWDSLVAALRQRHRVAPKGLQILEIRPEDSAGRRVYIQLNIGTPQPARAVTNDQGLTWKAL